MKPAYFGVVDCYIDGGSVNRTSRHKFNAANELFVSLFNAMSTDEAKVFGIERVAYNTGSLGIGMGYWDSSTPCGENAWAVFMFKSASAPFHVHFQVSGNDVFGSGSYPASMSSGPQNGVGFSFALRADRTSPWAGTVKNQGRDDKGPGTVWLLTGSSIFPRLNSTLGQFQTSSKAMIQLVSADALASDPAYLAYPTPNATWAKHARAHFLFNQENFLATVDVNANGTSNFVYFGQYDSVHESYLERLPYVCLASNAYEVNCRDGNYLGYFTGPAYVYGQTKTNFLPGNSGGEPRSFLNGGIADSSTQMVAGVATDVPSILNRGTFGANSNLWFPAPEGHFTLYNIPLWAIEGSGSGPSGNDATLKRGEWYLKGEATFIKFVNNITSNALLGSGSFLTFGPAAKNVLKLAMPWMPGDPGPGNNLTREGRKFIRYV